MNESELFVDTNIFVRFFVRDSKQTFEACRDLLEAIATKRTVALTSSAVIAEIHWTLKSYYNVNKRDAVDFVSRMLSMPNLQIDNRDDAAYANNLFGNSSIKFIDAIIASHPGIQNGSIAIVSYDKDFDKLGVRRLEPRDVVKKLAR